VPVPTSRLVPTSSVHLDAASATALQGALDTVVSGYAIPGAECAVVFPDGSMWTGTAGVAVLSTRQAWTADTLLSVGSITKTFTGALAMRLARQGKIGLDDPLSKYMASYPNAAKITLRQLMNHTSGIRDLFEPETYAYIEADKNATWTADQLLAKIGKPYFAPGRGYHYSSTNYVILGEVLEVATGQKLASLIRSEFLEPLGLTHTFTQYGEVPVGPLAHGYLRPSGAPKDTSVGQPLLPYTSVATATGGAGAMASTASDIARWASALYGGWVFDDATVASILDTTDTVPLKPKLPYGIGVEQFAIGSHLGWGHRGHLDGFWSVMVYLPDSGLTVALLTNADWINPLVQLARIVASVSPSPAGAGSGQEPPIGWAFAR
jgi:D-alanyl-D-alanine carboxypeptidase